MLIKMLFASYEAPYLTANGIKPHTMAKERTIIQAHSHEPTMSVADPAAVTFLSSGHETELHIVHIVNRGGSKS
jgi:hypothetical protein